ncbi:MAG: helix-turn-helix domain-containing protein [Thermomicrobiales bacterium]
MLGPALRAELRQALADPPPDGGLRTCVKGAAWTADRLGRPVGDQRGWEALRALGFTPQRPRPRATKADPVAQAAFTQGGSHPPSRRSGGLIPPHT